MSLPKLNVYDTILLDKYYSVIRTVGTVMGNKNEIKT